MPSTLPGDSAAPASPAGGSAPRPPLLEVDDLHLAFGARPAVTGLHLTIDAGETVALVGESGSGKSATALAIMRLIEREGGRIAGGRLLWHDDDLQADLVRLEEPALRRLRGHRVSMVFQEPMTSLNPVLTIGRQVAEVYRRHDGLRAADAMAAAREALERVRITDPGRRLGQYPHELSGGLRQRVMIAMALACRPRLLIADEPTTALDVTTQAEILRLIFELKREIGMAVLFITHDMSVVAELADRVVVLRRGLKVEDAPTGTLFAAPRADYTRALLAATPRLGAGGPPPCTPRPPVLAARGLRKSFGAAGWSSRRTASARVAAVDDVSVTIHEGETLGLVGESGCGKSTLARLLLRLVEPDAGEVTLAGHALARLSARELRSARRHAQMIFQDPYASLNPRLPVHELVTEPARIHGVVDAAGQRELAAELLRRVGLGTDALDRHPHQFSGGQRQRLSIARALSVRPKLIVADEPVSALDVSIARQITDLMLELQQQDGLSFLFISHDIAVVERVSHRIAVMTGGRIVEEGPTAQVLGAPGHAYTRRLLAAVPRASPDRRLAA